MNVLISSIQRLSLHDGPGIRTTVFFKGCSVHCPWCANPESLLPSKNLYLDYKKCIGDSGTCIFNAACRLLKNHFSDADLAAERTCPLNAVKVYGLELTAAELVTTLLKDKNYYGSDGGVTFSGGEALLYINELAPIIMDLKNKGINVCVESCLFVSEANISLAAKLIDHFIIDIKILEHERCKDIIGGNLDLYLKNLELIFKSNKSVVLRFPVVPGITDTAENLKILYDLLKKFQPAKVEIFSVHNLAKNKYYSLGWPYTNFEVATDAHLKEIKTYLLQTNIDIDICKL